jgi:hypothetical protein
MKINKHKKPLFVLVFTRVQHRIRPLQRWYFFSVIQQKSLRIKQKNRAENECNAEKVKVKSFYGRIGKRENGRLKQGNVRGVLEVSFL